MTNMLVFLSPAKTFDESFKSTINTTSHPVFINQAQELIDLLKGLSPEAIAKLMSVSPKIADLNFGRFKSWTSTGSYQALWLFAGDVYRGLESKDFSEDDVIFAQEHVRILSGLYGCLKPLDMMDPYRLEMGTKLHNAKGKTLYDFWGDLVVDMVHEANPEVVINLASEEYAKVLKRSHLKTRCVDIVFQEQKGDQRKIVAIYAKKARGLMTRYIVKNRITDPEGLKDFNLDRYQFDDATSSDTRLVFVR